MEVSTLPPKFSSCTSNLTNLAVFSNFYIARKTIERLFKAPLTIAHFIAWVASFYRFPITTTCLLIYYIYKLIPGYRKFFADNPEMKKYWWAAVVVDFSHIFIGPWAWLTLSDTTWERGEGKYAGREKVEEPAYHVR